jgi:hypothetical protein
VCQTWAEDTCAPGALSAGEASQPLAQVGPDALPRPRGLPMWRRVLRTVGTRSNSNCSAARADRIHQGTGRHRRDRRAHGGDRHLGRSSGGPRKPNVIGDGHLMVPVVAVPGDDRFATIERSADPLASWSRRPGRRGRRRSRRGALTAPRHGQEAVPTPRRPPGQSSVLRRGTASAIDTVGCAGGALPTQQGSPVTRTSLWVRSARQIWRPVPPQAVPWWTPLRRRTPQGWAPVAPSPTAERT